MQKKLNVEDILNHDQGDEGSGSSGDTSQDFDLNHVIQTADQFYTPPEVDWDMFPSTGVREQPSSDPNPGSSDVESFHSLDMQFTYSDPGVESQVPEYGSDFATPPVSEMEAPSQTQDLESDQIENDLSSPNHTIKIESDQDSLPCIDDDDDIMSNAAAIGGSPPGTAIAGGDDIAPLQGNNNEGMSFPNRPLTHNFRVPRVPYWRNVDTHGHFAVPNFQADNFVQRPHVLDQIMQRLSESLPWGLERAGNNQVVLEGLAGAGKTKLALQAAHKVNSLYPHISVFWLSATSLEEIKESYIRIAATLGIPLSGNIETMGNEVSEAIGQLAPGTWLYIIDTDEFTEPGDGNILWNSIPWERSGSVLITMRNRQRTLDLGIKLHNIIEVPPMSVEQATMLWRGAMPFRLTLERKIMEKFLEILGYSPLAIMRACDYIKGRYKTLRKAIQHYQAIDTPHPWTWDDNASLLDKLKNSFIEIEQSNKLAWYTFCFLCYLDNRAIRRSSLPPGADVDKGLEMLTARSFLLRHADSSRVDVHPAAKFALKLWLRPSTSQTARVNAASQPWAWGLPAPLRETYNRNMHLLDSTLRHGGIRSEPLADAAACANLALRFWVRGEYAGAERQLRKCADISQHTLGHRSHGTIELCRMVLSLFERYQRATAEAGLQLGGMPQTVNETYNNELRNAVIDGLYLLLAAFQRDQTPWFGMDF